ncbi:MAG TPA: outer membrane beta-barrel protein [Hanamia sp.]|nr:outer membrane beta-barrel protein [Hanamia sp.]
MKKIKIIIAALGIICFSQSANAQKGTFKLDLNYNYSLPISGFKSDLISDNSPRGFMGGLMYSFNDKLSAGLGFGFQDYYQKYPRALYPISKSQEVSAVLSNSIQTTPVILEAKYFPLSASFLKPYVSVGAGANIIDFNQYLGEFGSGQTSVGFRAQGGLGVMIPFTKFSSSGINVGATYDYASYHKFGYNDLSSVNFQAGVTINLK